MTALQISLQCDHCPASLMTIAGNIRRELRRINEFGAPVIGLMGAIEHARIHLNATRRGAPAELIETIDCVECDLNAIEGAEFTGPLNAFEALHEFERGLISIGV